MIFRHISQFGSLCYRRPSACGLPMTLPINVFSSKGLAWLWPGAPKSLSIPLVLPMIFGVRRVQGTVIFIVFANLGASQKKRENFGLWESPTLYHAPIINPGNTSLNQIENPTGKGSSGSRRTCRSPVIHALPRIVGSTASTSPTLPRPRMRPANLVLMMLRKVIFSLTSSCPFACNTARRDPQGLRSNLPGVTTTVRLTDFCPPRLTIGSPIVISLMPRIAGFSGCVGMHWVNTASLSRFPRLISRSPFGTQQLP